MSVRVPSHQQVCLNKLQLNCKLIFICGLSQQIYMLHLRQTPSYVTMPVHQTIRHVCYRCTWPAAMSFYVDYYQHTCVLQFHLVSIHVYYFCTRPMSVTITSSHLPFLSQVHLTNTSDTLAHVQHSYLYINIQSYVLSVALVPDQYSSNVCYNCTGSAGLYFQLHPTGSQDGKNYAAWR